MCDILNRVAKAVSVVVSRVDAPLVAGAVVGGVLDPVANGILKVKICFVIIISSSTGGIQKPRPVKTLFLVSNLDLVPYKIPHPTSCWPCTIPFAW